MEKGNKRCEWGFTLIEIVIALLVLAIGLVGLLALFPVGFDAAARAGDITTATFLAQSLIEDAKREGYDGLTVGTTEVIFVDNANFTHDYPKYESEKVVEDPGAPGVRKVTVKVYWPADAGELGSRDNQKNVEFATYIADYGS